LPSFSSVRKADVERGILASNQPATNIKQFFRRIALNVEAIISGTNPSELPRLSYKNKLTINNTTAEQIGFPMRYSMLATADIIGSDTEVEPESSIVDIMKSVVGENLALKAAQKDIDLTTQEIKTAKSSYLPDLSVGVDGIYVEVKTRNFQLREILFCNS